MLSNIGIPGLILILIALLIVFGPSKLPEIGKAFGNSLREFKKATNGLVDEAGKASKKDASEEHTEAPVVEPIELKATAVGVSDSAAPASSTTNSEK